MGWGSGEQTTGDRPRKGRSSVRPRTKQERQRLEHMDWYFVGVDFGQSRDFTAIAVLERAETRGAWDPVMFAWKKEVSLQLRYLERVALGTPYPEVVDRVVQVTQSRELAGRCRLAVDGTGVGRSVVDLLREAR